MFGSHLRLLLVVALVAIGLAPGSGRAQEAPVLAADTLPDAAFSPRGAFFRSVLLPGWGQAHVGAPGRGAVYFTLAAGAYTMTYVARRDLLDARREEEQLREAGILAENDDTEFVLSRERQFEDWAALSIFLVFLSGADAYVSAYLSDFNDRIGVAPAPDGSLRIEARFR